MNNSLIITFSVLTIVNVVLSTTKSLITVRGSPWFAALFSGIYYGFYSIVIIYTVADFPLWQKMAITFACNLIGVYLVKWVEAKREKEKLWLVKVTISPEAAEFVKKRLTDKGISYTYYDVTKFVVFDCFCSNREETQAVTQLCKAFDGKMFATENKLER